VMVNYDNFFSEVHRLTEMARLMAFVGHAHPESVVREILDRVVDPALRHHAARDMRGLPGYARRQYEQLNERHAAHAVPLPV